MARRSLFGEFSKKTYHEGVMAVAVSLALASTGAQAAASNGWVPTRTNPALVKSADTTARSGLQAAYNLNIDGHPSLDGATLSPLESSQPLHVVVSLNLHNTDELAQFNRQLNVPGSANYHKYLTPAEFKAKYSPTDAEVAAVVAHLQQNGFTHIEVAPNNLLVSADGNAVTVQSAFQASIKRFNFGGRSVYANDSAALVPASLGSIISGVAGLSNVAKPRTFSHRYYPAALLPTASASGPSALATAASSQVGHEPTDFAKIYDASGLPAATNTTVGIITWGPLTQTIKDLNTFTANAGLATVNTKVVTTGSGTLADDGSDVEWDLDSQDIIGVSGGVKQLIFYTAVNGDSSDSDLTGASLTAAYNKAVTDNEAKVINVSLGIDEAAAYSDGSQAADDAVFAQAVAQGQTFSIASGDAGVYQWSTSPYGAPGYIGTYSNGTVTTKINLSTYSVSEPATSPNVIAVGGTTLSTTGTTTWAGETVWNEGVAYADVSSSGTALDNAVRIWATGGGVSKYETAPSWQTSALGSSITKRALPDLAFDAAQSTGALIVIDGEADQQVGGTSLASPIFVGAWARIESANDNSIGFPAADFYQAIPSNASLVHDVTSGNNGYNGYGYNAASGWDYTTGFGSLDVAQVNSYAQANWATSGNGDSGSTANVAPVADFGDTVSGLTASFTDSSTDSDGSIASRAWDFGDGSTSTSTNPSHTYTAAGTYTVTLTVTDNEGATNTKTASVTVTSSGLQDGVAVTGISGSKGAQLKYTVTVPSGVSKLTITTTGSSSAKNDADLYVKRGSQPTTSSYGCRSWATGSNETCTFSSPTAGTYYILLYGYTAFSGVSLKASW